MTPEVSGVANKRGCHLHLASVASPGRCFLTLRPAFSAFPRSRFSAAHRATAPGKLRCSFLENSTQRGQASSGFSSSRDSEGAESLREDDFIVATFYKFVAIEYPEAEVAKHLNFLQGLDIRGRIYLNKEGINAQYSGPTEDAMAYVEWLKEDYRFYDILVQTSAALRGHAFPRLKMRCKPSLVQLEGGISHRSLLDPTMRATPLTPCQWRKRLRSRTDDDTLPNEVDRSTSNRKFLLLDVRNGYEWDIGHFREAGRPDVDCFRSTSFGLSEQEVVSSDPLMGIDKESTDILMYCTGGIRCDIYSTILRQKGFNNLYALSGGVSNYLKSEGPAEWVGNLFVFDSRLSLPPTTFKATNDDEERSRLISQSSILGRCYVCESELLHFRHRNCANLDCNRLFLCCPLCVERLRGCCCLDCLKAPRLRPVLPGGQRYKKWHVYRHKLANI